MYRYDRRLVARLLHPMLLVHFNNRVWTNNNQRHSPYPRSKYGNREHSDNHNSSQQRQERDYTKRTDFQERRPRYSDEGYSERYRDYHYRDHYHRYQPRWNEDNSSRSPYHRDEIGSVLGRDNSPKSPYNNDETGSNLTRPISDINRNNEYNCEPRSEASKTQADENQYQSKETKLDQVHNNDQRASENSAIESSTVASKEQITVASKANQNTETNGLKERYSPAEPNRDSEKRFKPFQITRKTPTQKQKEPDQRAEELPTVSRLLIEELNRSKPSEKTSVPEAGQSFPRISVRPLIQLVRQELFAVTQEDRLGKKPLQSPPPSASPASPSRLIVKPTLRNRRRTVSNCNHIAGSPSTSHAGDNEASINDRIASMDKESLKYIINNGDTIYEQHLQIQARRRLRDEIRRQLKTIELEQPKDNPVNELVEDEIVDAIKLPERLLQEIEKCFGIDISDGQKDQDSKKDNEDPTKSKITEGNQISGKDSEGSGGGTSNSVGGLQEIEESKAGVKKTKKTIKDSKKCIKGNKRQKKQQECSLESKDNNYQNLEADDLTNSSEYSKGDPETSVKSIGGSKKVLQENNKKKSPKKKSPKKKFKGALKGQGKSKKNLGAEINQSTPQIEGHAETSEPFDCMDGSKHHMARLKAADKVKSLAGIRKNRPALLPTPTFGRIADIAEIPKLNSEDPKLSRSPTSKVDKNSEKEITPVVSPPENNIPIQMEIKRESSSSPITVLPLPSKDVIDLLSSSDEEEKGHGVVDTDLDEPEKEIVTPSDKLSVEALLGPKPPTADDAASDHSTSSQCSSESTKRRRRLKLQSDAENVVDSFEKLILPHLREALTDRYRRQHSTSLQSRLHFISCVVTSSEHNSQSFSKIEVAKMQMNLKSADNRQAIEFLLREIVNVVNLQKQRRREQDDEQKLSSLLSPKKTQSPVEETTKATSSSPPIRQKTPVLASHESPTTSSGHQSLSVLSSPKPTTSSAQQSSLVLSSPQPSLPLAAHESPKALVNQSQNPEPFPVGLPFLAMDPSLSHFSAAGYSRLGGGANIGDPLGHLGDMVAQNLVDIDRRLLENQNRRSILEEMIMKFQKEKSDLEMLSLELQSRKFLLINSMISRGQASSSVPVAKVRNSPPQDESTQESMQEENSSKGGIARRTRSRLRRVVSVKVASKRPARVQKRVVKKHKSGELIAHLQQEIANQEECNKASEEQAQETESGLSIQSNIKEEPLEESIYDQIDDSSATTKVTQSRLGKPKASVAASPAHQQLAIIPPLPPPPPPPEPIGQMSYEGTSSFLKDQPYEPEQHWSQLNSQEECRLSFVPMGKLHYVRSPITQIKIYREYVIAAAEDGDIYMFHLVSHKLERKITKHSEAITNMCISEKDSTLYTTSLDGFFKKSSLENLERVIETVYLKEPLQSIDIAWGLAFIGSRWGHISTFNVLTNKVMDNPLVQTDQSIIAIKATKEGVRKILVLGCKGNVVQMHDAGTGLLLRRVCIPEGLNVYSLLLNDGHIYCGTQKNEIYQLEFDTGNLVTKLSCGNGAVAIVSYKERYLLVGCYDGFIYVLDKVAGKKVGRFEGAGRLVLALTVAGDKIVTSSKDNTLEILKVPAALVNGH
ncbi:uncharacterized protein LOC119548191 isoform X3 [Drosophila subpulchrella]|uniref:uncharacterized protein LOC119548191 isoform X3 n=1 Tax=Drosophila subpulchrella TaxID=1486046 RepID=UPI0018A157C6|nr:uncharacterized protein LOC119548191 isoform X3 [Drosophila subpulchrella]